jgi:YidC/Oxa1 family membrane protein insertase
MEIWQSWTALLSHTINLIVGQFGLTEAMAVILLTLLVRVLLLPISLTSALRMEANKQKMKLLKPELDALKALHKNDAAKLATETMRLYRERQVRLLDRWAFANIGTQGVFGVGLFQTLSKAALSSKFLWISNLARPDLLLTVIVGALMLLGMALMPGATAEPSMLLMMVVSVAVATFTILALPSAVGLYWATSNAVTVLQTLVLRAVLQRQGARAA